MTADELQATIVDLTAQIDAIEQRLAAHAAAEQAAPRPEQLEALKALARRLADLAPSA